jgi:sec-independent protein translocase protein TatA
MPNLGVWEILLILLVVLIVFGPKRLPEMGRSLGRGMREFKDSISSAAPTEQDLEGESQEETNAARPVPTVVHATATPSVATATPSAPTGEGESADARPASGGGNQAAG